MGERRSNLNSAQGIQVLRSGQHHSEVKLQNRLNSEFGAKSTSNRPKVGLKSAQSCPKFGSKSAWGRPKVAWAQPEVGLKLAQSRPKVGLKSALGRPKVGLKLAQSQPPSREKVGPELAKSRPDFHISRLAACQTPFFVGVPWCSGLLLCQCVRRKDPNLAWCR